MKRDLAMFLLLAAAPALVYAIRPAGTLPFAVGLAAIVAAGTLSGLLAWRLLRQAAEHTAEVSSERDIVLRTEKLASLSRLVAGVAHELNNPLAAIMGEAAILNQRCAQPELRRGLQIIEQQAARCARIVRDLRAFAGIEQRQVQPLDLHALLEGALAQAALAAPAQEVAVVRQYAPGPLIVRGNMEQLQEALANVLGNAYQAMAGGPPGQLTLRSARTGDGTVRLQVADSGVGIEREALPYVFDPFYSKRPARLGQRAPWGQGVGLGLSVALGQVRAHGGRIWAESEPGKGTTVFIELPCVTSEAGNASRRDAEAQR